jgi:tetratricopeptide (TPR) repeat protein
MNPVQRLAIVLVVLVLMTGATAALGRYYHESKHRYARQHFAAGMALLSTGHQDQAIVELRAALGLERDRPEYAVVLASALLDAGYAREAQAHLDAALRADPTSGPANLIRARVAQELGDLRADVYYQRAFFGSWPADAADQRVGAGFDMVAYLSARGERDRAVATLVQLAAEAGDDNQRAVHIAGMLNDLAAHGEARALAQRVTDRSPQEPGAWGVLAEASFAQGDDRAARQAATLAARLDRDNPRWRYLVGITTDVLSLDPTVPRLRGAERLRRARALLQRTLAAVNTCIDPDAGEDPAAARAEAARLLAERHTQADIDTLTDMAVRVWEQRPPSCPVGRDIEPLARVFARLTAPPVEP